jgi:hypothetical protein
MSLTRRRFVEVASLSLLAGVAIPSAISQDDAPARDDPFRPENLLALNEASQKTFERFIDERFTIRNAKRALGSLTLISVEAAPPAPAPAKQMVGRVPKVAPQAAAGFSLRFRGSGGELPQGTYTFRNAGLGSFPLFIVPSGPGLTPPTYTAVFTLLVEPART